MRTCTFHAPSGATLTFTALGQGCAPLGNLYRPISERQAQETLAAAWRAGIRYFDVAPLYGLGLAETRLNHFLRGRPRDRYVLSTKVGRRLAVCPPAQRTGRGAYFDTPSRREVYDYTYDGVMRSFEDSLERLGVDRVDVLYAHDLDVFTHRFIAARDGHVRTFMRGGYRALLRLRASGVVKAIGAGVNEWEVCQMLAERGDFDLFLLAGRYTLLEQEALETFMPLCERRGIGIVIGGAYNSGILATGATPGAFYNYRPAPQAVLARVRRLDAACHAHGVALVEAALRFPFGHSSVVSVIPGASHPREVARNIRTLTANIPRALWTDLRDAGLIREDAPLPQ